MDTHHAERVRDGTGAMLECQKCWTVEIPPPFLDSQDWPSFPEGNRMAMVWISPANICSWLGIIIPSMAENRNTYYAYIDDTYMLYIHIYTQGFAIWASPFWIMVIGGSSEIPRAPSVGDPCKTRGEHNIDRFIFLNLFCTLAHFVDWKIPASLESIWMVPERTSCQRNTQVCKARTAFRTCRATSPVLVDFPLRSCSHGPCSIHIMCSCLLVLV